MFQKVKNRLKDQKGFTLIELLAVIVILGIIAAIAVPSIIGLINNSKADAHVANAEQIVRAAKIYIADEKVDVTSTEKSISIGALVDKGYLETIDDPSGTGYDTTDSKVLFSMTPADSTNGTPASYKYYIYLESNEATAHKYLGTAATAADAEDMATLDRDAVNLP